MKNWKVILGVFLVFAFGVAAGWIGATVVHLRMAQSILQKGTDGIIAVVEKRLTRNLSLDSTQQTQVHQIFLQYAAQRKELQQEIRPSVQQLNRETFVQISALLRPEQKEILLKNISTMRKRINLGDDATTDAAQPPAAATTNAPAAGQ